MVLLSNLLVTLLLYRENSGVSQTEQMSRTHRCQPCVSKQTACVDEGFVARSLRSGSMRRDSRTKYAVAKLHND